MGSSIFTGSGIKIYHNFGIRDKKLGQKTDQFEKNIPCYYPVIQDHTVVSAFVKFGNVKLEYTFTNFYEKHFVRHFRRRLKWFQSCSTQLSAVTKLNS